MAGGVGFEPTHAGAKDPCLTDLANPQKKKNCSVIHTPLKTKRIMFYRINQFAVKGYDRKIQIVLSILISDIYKDMRLWSLYIFRLFCVLMDNLFYKAFTIA